MRELYRANLSGEKKHVFCTSIGTSAFAHVGNRMFHVWSFARLSWCVWWMSACDVDLKAAYPNFVLPFFPSAKTKTMDRSRKSAPWSGHRRDDDNRRRSRDDEFDDLENFVAKKKRELGDLKSDADRLRRERNRVNSENDRLEAEMDRMKAENDRLRAEIDAKSAVIAQLEQQSRDAAEALTKRFKIALDNAFAEVLDAPAAHEDAISTSEEEGAGNADPAPTLPESAAAAGPGDAAGAAPPTREGGGGGEHHDQPQVLEPAAHHPSEIAPPDLGGQ